MSIDTTTSPEDVLWFRQRAIAATGVSVAIADARRADTPLIDVNPAFELLTGYEARDILDRNCRFLQGPRTDSATTARMRAAIAGAGRSIEVVLNYRRDGTPFWNEVSISPVHDQHGVLTHFVGVQQDVSAREQARFQLELLARASDLIGHGDPLEATLEAIGRAIVQDFADSCDIRIHHDHGGMTYHIGRGERAPVPIGDDVPASGDQQRITTDVATVMRTGAAIVRGGRLEAAGGHTPGTTNALSEREEMIVPIRTSREVYGTISLTRDCPGFAFSADEFRLSQDIGLRIGSAFETARLMHRAESALISRERFLSKAAHELRTPIVSVKGYAQLLLRSLDRDTLTRERLRQAIHTIDASVGRLSALTDDLLAMSRDGLDTTPLRIDRIHTGSFLATVVTRSELLSDHQIDLDTTLAATHFEADSARIDQVMSTILSNAATYSDPTRPILIEAKSENGGLRITFHDGGRGLAVDELDGIFEMFAPADAGNGASGLGLSLFASRRIVERHGGKLWAESDGRGLGSRLNLWLPDVRPSHDDRIGPTAPEGDVDQR